MVDAFRAASDGALPVVPRRPRCAAPRGARASVVLILSRARALVARDVSRARARPSDGWLRPFVRCKTRVNHFQAEERTASRSPPTSSATRCTPSADTYFSSLARFRCRRSASVSWCRERSHWLHTKCINSGAKLAHCAATAPAQLRHNKRNEAVTKTYATHDAVPRARRKENRLETRPARARRPRSCRQSTAEEAPASRTHRELHARS